MNDKEKNAIGMCRLLLNGDITLHVIDDDGGTAYAGTVNKTYNDDLETILNLIENQKAELEKKEAIINEMAKHIHLSGDYECLNKECEDDGNIDCEECIKEYFTKKVEGK